MSKSDKLKQHKNTPEALAKLKALMAEQRRAAKRAVKRLDQQRNSKND